MDDQTHPPGDSFKHILHKLKGLDKELSSISGSLKVETAKKILLEERIEREKCKLFEIRDNPDNDDGIREDTRNKITRLNDDHRSS